MDSDKYARLEAIAQELIDIYQIKLPPVPIESILQSPKSGMWDEVNVGQLSGTFLNIRERYSPRMSIARLLARHITQSNWGEEQGLFDLIKEQGDLSAFARMLILPKQLLENVNEEALNPSLISLQFEVPEDDARIRLEELPPN